MMIKRLDRNDEKKLADFLSELSDNTLLLWNRFGKINNKAAAESVANAQVSKDRKEEIGYIVRNAEKIEGYGFLRFFPEKPQKKTTCTLGIVIADKCQGSGIGSKLLEYMINDAKAFGMKKIWLGTYSNNLKALKLYRKMGFQVEGIFMSDEIFNGIPFHTVSMALFLDGSGDEQSEKRRKLMHEIESGSIM